MTTPVAGANGGWEGRGYLSSQSLNISATLVGRGFALRSAAPRLYWTYHSGEVPSADWMVFIA